MHSLTRHVGQMGRKSKDFAHVLGGTRALQMAMIAMLNPMAIHGVTEMASLPLGSVADLGQRYRPSGCKKRKDEP